MFCLSFANLPFGDFGRENFVWSFSSRPDGVEHYSKGRRGKENGVQKSSPDLPNEEILMKALIVRADAVENYCEALTIKEGRAHRALPVVRKIYRLGILDERILFGAFLRDPTV